MASPNQTQPNALRTFLGSWTGLATLCLLAVAGLYLFLSHTGHILSAFPYFLLLACPLLHLLMHRGHDHSGPKE